ncbi:hypothetical protein BH23GEM7_BH23GEM7_25980 [soil metagenome]|jgi:plastocyanin
MKRSLVLAVLLQVGCSSGGGTATEPPRDETLPPAPATAQVEMRSQDDGYGTTGHSFTPPQVRVRPGGSVTWSNATGVIHNVTFDAAPGAPSHVAEHTSGANTRSFPTPGTFSYRCTFHAGMEGTVQVTN